MEDRKGLQEALAFFGGMSTPPRPDKPSTDSIRHPMFKDLDGRYWPIIIQQLEFKAEILDDEGKWDVEVDGELF